MKLLFDANLSPRLVEHRQDLYSNSTHVFDHGEIAVDDAAIWALARRDGYVIATKDTDFLELSLLHGAPPKVVLLRIGNAPTAKALAVLVRHRDRVRRFADDPYEATLIIDG
ncbi:MAG: DUF5615 family PIN-like protein [Hyphomicrobium aestuarii]|nr:DUF5615 family PIN-like protein [Hyphomicrobium aestuarii]